MHFYAEIFQIQAFKEILMQRFVDYVAFQCSLCLQLHINVAHFQALKCTINQQKLRAMASYLEPNFPV